MPNVCAEGLEADLRADADALGPVARVSEERGRAGGAGGGVVARVGRELSAAQGEVDLVRGPEDRTPVEEVVTDKHSQVVRHLDARVHADLGNHREAVAGAGWPNARLC